MSDFLKNDKALVIFAVFFLVLGYMVISALVFKQIELDVLTPALTGLFGVAVGQRLRTGDSNGTVPTITAK